MHLFPRYTLTFCIFTVHTLVLPFRCFPRHSSWYSSLLCLDSRSHLVFAFPVPCLAASFSIHFQTFGFARSFISVLRAFPSCLAYFRFLPPFYLHFTVLFVYPRVDFSPSRSPVSRLLVCICLCDRSFFVFSSSFLAHVYFGFLSSFPFIAQWYLFVLSCVSIPLMLCSLCVFMYVRNHHQSFMSFPCLPSHV